MPAKHADGRQQPGRKGDPRMNRAVEAREADPQMPLLDALMIGGFVFPDVNKEGNPKKLHDTEGVSLYQRRNQLMRRIRASKLSKQSKQRSASTVVSKNQKLKAEEVCPSADICHSSPPSTTNDSNPMLPSQRSCRDVESESFDVLALENMAFDEVIYPQDEFKEHFSLSEKEQAEIEGDLFGTTEILGACFPVTAVELHDFDEALNEIDTAKKWALIQAEKTCPLLVGNKQKEMFLRWADFNVKQAADRFVTYWNMRHHLYGPKAYFPLTLDQMSEKDMIALQSGIYSILPQKDEHGRALIWIDPSRRDRAAYNAENEVRYFWCIIHSVLEDVTVQEKGFVFLVFGKNVNVLKHFDRRCHKFLWNSLNTSLPFKLKAVHFIKPPPFISLVLPVMKYLFGRKVRHRVRFHSGNNEEVLESLSTYGISEDALPNEIDGRVDFKLCAQ